MQKPLVSVTIITYNQVRFIRETLLSALDQAYENLEVVVADDCSTDGTRDIILELAHRYPDRLVCIFNQENLGITGNSNRALQACRGKYIAFQGGDDVFLPGKIQQQVEWMEVDENRVLCGHDVEIFESATGNTIALWSSARPLRHGNGPASIIKYGVPYAATAVMVRKSAIPAYGFDSRVPTVSDWKLWVDCLTGGGEFGYVDGIFARYRRSDQNISKKVPIMVRDRLVTLAIIESMYPVFLADCQVQRAQAYYDLGIYFMKQKQYKEARKFFRTAVTTAVFRHKKAPIAYGLTFLPPQWGQFLLVDRATPRKLSDYLSAITGKKP
jgi:glycosyltransferase involved in cell wall biosynthesis